MTNVEVKQVIPILLGGRYVIIVEDRISDRQLLRLQDDIGQWVLSDKQFIILAGGMKLVRVDEVE